MNTYEGIQTYKRAMGLQTDDVMVLDTENLEQLQQQAQVQNYQMPPPPVQKRAPVLIKGEENTNNTAYIQHQSYQSVTDDLLSKY